MEHHSLGETVTAASAPFNKTCSAQSESVDNVPSSSLDTASGLDYTSAAEDPIPSGYEVRHGTSARTASRRFVLVRIFCLPQHQTELFSP